MTLVVETSLLIADCRRELKRLNELAGDFRTANDMSRDLLTGAFKMRVAENARDRQSGASSIRPDPQAWRARAEQTRTFAEFVLEPGAKRLFLEIAESYDQMGR